MIKKIIPCLLILIIAVFVFSEGLFTDKHIVSYDNRPTEAVSLSQILHNSVYNKGWSRNLLLGSPYPNIPYNKRIITMKLFEPVFYLKFTYFLSTLLGGLFFFFLLRNHKLSKLSSLFGSIAIMLNNHLITHTLPGHLGKAMAFTWIPLVFLFLRKGVIQNTIRYYIYSALFLGLSFYGQAYQISLYFALLTFFYFIYLVLQQREINESIKNYIKTKFKKIVKPVSGYIMMFLLTLMISSTIIPHVTQSTETRKEQNNGNRMTSSQRWGWATQWSLPPEEIIDFILPGFFGWKTGDKESPYWGRLGKSPDGGRSLPNLKLNNENMGMILFLFMIFALYVKLKDRTHENKFWFGVLLTAFFLALGKYLYLPYYLFYSLPYMDLIRNPNKFLPLVSFAAAIIGAYGFEYLFYKKDEEDKILSKKYEKFIKFLKYFIFSLGASLIIFFIFSDSIANIIETRTKNSFGAQNIVDYIPIIFLIGIAVASFAYYVFSNILKKNSDTKTKMFLAHAVIGVLTFELWLSGRHFIKHFDGSKLYTSDPVVNFINDKKEPTRVMFYKKDKLSHNVSQYYIRNKFAYHYVNYVDISQLANKPGRYSDLYNGLKHNIQTLLTTLNINYIISTEDITNLNVIEVKRFPLGRNKFIKIYKLKNGTPRAYNSYGYKIFNNNQDIANYLQKTNYNPYLEVCVEKKYEKELANFSKISNIELTNLNSTQSVTINQYENNSIALSTESKYNSILIFQDYYNKDWKVNIDDKPAKIIPVNIVHRGVILPAGKHKIKYLYRPDSLHYKISMAGFLIVLAAFIYELFIFYKSKKE